MEKSNVYFADFHTVANGDGLAAKLKKLIRAAGIGQIDMEGKFAAIKMHFGELGNLSFLRPNYARAVADVVKELGGMPDLTDCNTLYPGSRKNALEHLYCAWENGFTPLTVGCPILIGDGLKGTDEVAAVSYTHLGWSPRRAGPGRSPQSRDCRESSACGTTGPS